MANLLLFFIFQRLIGGVMEKLNCSFSHPPTPREFIIAGQVFRLVNLRGLGFSSLPSQCGSFTPLTSVTENQALPRTYF